MFPVRHEVTITTDAAGDATGYTAVAHGRILSVRYAKAASGNYTDGVDFTITLEKTGEQVWTEVNVNASKVVYPRVGVHDTVGVAATLNGTQAMRDYLHAENDRVKIVVAAGGDTKVGTFHVTTG